MSANNAGIDFLNSDNLALALKEMINDTFLPATWFITTFIIPEAKTKAIRIYVSPEIMIENVKEFDVMLTLKRPVSEIGTLRENFNTLEELVIGRNYTITYNSVNYRVISFLPNRQPIESLTGTISEGNILISRNYTAKIVKLDT